MIKSGHGIHIEKCGNKSRPKFYPQPHQLFVRDKMLEIVEKNLNGETETRGLILYHLLGSGKSCSSIITADSVMKKFPDVIKRVFVLSGGSLRKNMMYEYCKKCGKSPKALEKKYAFITYNTNVGNYLPNFEGSVVIIDEFHNLINGVKNGSKNYTAIYEALQNSKNVFILLLSGTPIVKRPKEIMIAVSIVKPNIDAGVLGVNKKILGQSYGSGFSSIFSMDNNDEIVLVDVMLYKKVFGEIFSYFPGEKENYPEIVEEKIIKCVMTPWQELNYFIAANTEKDLLTIKLDTIHNPSMRKLMESLKIMAIKGIISRQPSNFSYPELVQPYLKKVLVEDTEEIICLREKLQITKDRKERDELLEKLNESRLKSKEDQKGGYYPDELTEHEKKRLKLPYDLDVPVKNQGWISKSEFIKHKIRDIYSSKFSALLNKIADNFFRKHMVYSFFKERSGTKLLSAILNMCGVKTVLYTGDLSAAKRESLLNEFNSEENMYGDKIKVILLTEAGGEGITLKDVGVVHILESNHKEAKIRQAIGRAVRFKSHEGLPKSDRTVKIYRYWSVLSGNRYTINTSAPIQSRTSTGQICRQNVKITVGGNSEMKSIDETFYDKGVKDMKLIDGTLKFLQKISIEKMNGEGVGFSKEVLFKGENIQKDERIRKTGTVRRRTITKKAPLKQKAQNL